MRRTGPALLVVHVAWAVHLCLSYYLASAACDNDSGWLLMLRHLTTVVSLGLALGSMWLAWRAVAMTTHELRGGGAPGAGETLAEHGYLARLTLVLGAVLVLGILLAGTANLFLVPCL